MRKTIRTVLLAAAAASAATTDASAQHRPRADAWWEGLPQAREQAPARGVQTVRLPPEGRVRVPGGHFKMGSEPTDLTRAIALCHREMMGKRCDEQEITGLFRAEMRAHEVTLSPYSIDKTEVTVAAYGRCTAVGVCAAPGFTPGDLRFDRPDLPIVMLRWEDADTYCQWAGGRLPTEAEWEFAARGPTSREYPWGSFYNPHLCNHGAFANDQTDATDGFLGLAPVGSFPDGATALGLLDMAGNAAEYVADTYVLDEDLFGYPGTPQVNPRGPTSGSIHVVRGGSYTEGAAWMRGASRGAVSSQHRSASIGFRCAEGGTEP